MYTFLARLAERLRYWLLYLAEMIGKLLDKTTLYLARPASDDPITPHNHWAERTRQHIHQQADTIGNLLVETFHYMALFAIGGCIIWASVGSFMEMLNKGEASIDDILLFFIYLELGAMVGIYFKTNRMPVRFLIYVAITALTRMMIGDIQHNHKPNMGIIMVSGAILLLAFANLVVRYGSYRFPSSGSHDGVVRPKIQAQPSESD
jgi:protein PsiE